MSARMMEALTHFSNETEIYSIDEAFVRFDRSPRKLISFLDSHFHSVFRAQRDHRLKTDFLFGL